MTQPNQPLNIAFCKARADDLGEIVRLFRAAIRHMDAQGIPQWDEIYPSAEVLADDLARDELYAGTAGGRIVCAFTLSPRCDPEYALAAWRRPDSRYCVVHRLCVHPDFQHRRAAAQAMAFIEDTLRTQAFESVRLDAFSLNPYALRLYERLGYEKTGEVTFRKGLFYLYEKAL
ncbi:MAG TPA: GNAT family N-acetyltransferase [Eubacteriales bacterium]|nr:GNAT family N-acetyltransferase [Eubacteriales bacterium]